MPDSLFDSSYERKKPISFPLNHVIKGWTESMQLVGEGGMIELEIPSDLGYGDRGIPGTIPGGASLHFLVELLKIDYYCYFSSGWDSRKTVRKHGKNTVLRS